MSAENKLDNKIIIREGLEEFANETPIAGIRELFKDDAVVVLKVIWGIFLLVCVGLMLNQIVQACIGYRNENTVINIELQNVVNQFEGTLDVCFRMDSMLANLFDEHLTPNFGLMVGQLFIGGRVIFKKPTLWMNLPQDRINTTMNLNEFTHVNGIQDDSNALNSSFTERIQEILYNFQVNDFLAHNYIGLSSIDQNAWCTAISYKPFTHNKNDNNKSDVKLDFTSSTYQDLAITFYTIASSDPYDPSISSNLRLYSSAEVADQKASQRRRAETEAEIKNSTKQDYNHDSVEFPYYDTNTFVTLSATKFIVPNLRRKPCTQFGPEIVLPAGKSEDACTTSCMVQVIRDLYNCSLEKQMDIFPAPEAATCHWFKMIEQYRSKLNHNCTLLANADEDLDNDIVVPPYLDQFKEYTQYDTDAISTTDEPLEFDLDGSGGYGDESDGTTPEASSTAPTTICDLQMTPLKWSQLLVFMIYTDFEDRKIACVEKCQGFKSCIEWEIEYKHERTQKFHHSFHNEQMTLFVIKPNIITIFKESLAATTGDLIGNLGGIFGFYFGFSIVSIVHIIFFVSYRLLRDLKNKRQISV